MVGETEALSHVFAPHLVTGSKSQAFLQACAYSVDPLWPCQMSYLFFACPLAQGLHMLRGTPVPPTSQAKGTEDQIISLTEVQSEKGGGKHKLPGWICLLTYIKPSFPVPSCLMWDCRQAHIPSAGSAAAYRSISQGSIWEPNQISVMLRHVQSFRKELKCARHDEDNTSHMYWNLDACLCFLCFCERQLKDPIGEILVPFLAMLFVISANVVERRGKQNDFEMQTCASMSSEWLGESEWQQASSVCHFPGCSVLLRISKALWKGTHLF